MNSEEEQEAGELLDYAYYYLNRGDLEQANELALEARDLFDELQLAGGSAQSRWLLGFIQYEMGEFKAALPLLASAQQQFALIGQMRQHCATLFLLARCHLGLERPNKAIYALKLARDAFESKKEDPTDQERNAFMPDWETLKELITGLLDELEAQSHQSD